MVVGALAIAIWGDRTEAALTDGWISIAVLVGATGLVLGIAGPSALTPWLSRPADC